MRKLILLFPGVILCSFAAEPNPRIPVKITAVLAQANIGHVAFCQPNAELDELQIIGEPRWLTEAEAKRLATVFASDMIAGETSLERG